MSLSGTEYRTHVTLTDGGDEFADTFHGGAKVMPLDAMVAFSRAFDVTKGRLDGDRVAYAGVHEYRDGAHVGEVAFYDLDGNVWDYADAEWNLVAS